MGVPRPARDAPALGQVRFDERAVLPGQFAERMQRLHHPGALRPAAARAGGQRHHGHLARSAKRVQPIASRFGLLQLRSVRSVGDIVFLHVLDHRAGGQAVLRQADPALLQIGADLLVLHAVKAVLLPAARQVIGRLRFRFAARQHDVEQRLHHAAQLGRVRQAAPNLSSSARRSGESAWRSCRSNAGTVSV